MSYFQGSQEVKTLRIPHLRVCIFMYCLQNIKLSQGKRVEGGNTILEKKHFTDRFVLGA